MACFKPLEGYPTSDGRLVFSRPPGHSGRVQPIPCRQCIGCRLDYATQWGVRMMDEAACHEWNWFLTLTYSDENLPPHGSLRPRDMQLFWKRVRKAGLSGRHGEVGEYGETTGRPHYHAAAFGLELDDLVLFQKNERGEPLWTSRRLEELWPHGHSLVGMLTMDSARYIAGYMVRDTRAKDEGRYDVLDLSTGDLVPRVPPYFRMSRRPGIGAPFLDRFFGDVFPRDQRRVGNQLMAVPSYYHKRLEVLNPEMAESVKAKREDACFSDSAKRERRPERLRVREVVKKAQIRSGRRGSSGGAL